jgi:hypothetical protein
VTKDKSQIDKFREAARELRTDDREETFDAKLKKIATASSGQGTPTTKPRQTATLSSRSKTRSAD